MRWMAADAAANTPQGRMIHDSEETARDALERFRKMASGEATHVNVRAAQVASHEFPTPIGRRIVFGDESLQGRAWLEEVLHTYWRVGRGSANPAQNLQFQRR